MAFPLIPRPPENSRQVCSLFMMLLGSVLLFATIPEALPRAAQDSAPPPKENPKPPGAAEKQKENPKPAAAPKACCSCVKSLRLAFQHNGPIETPPETKWVDDSEDPSGEKVIVSTGSRRQPGHVFQVLIRFETKKSDTQGNLTLHWFEKADSLPSMIKRAGIQPNTWYDAQEVLTTSQAMVRKADGKEPQPNNKASDLETIAEYVKRHQGTATDWVRRYLNDKSKICPLPASVVYIDDKPAARQPRKLEFHIVVENPQNCGCSDPPKLELWATQLLVAKPGQSSVDQAQSGFYGPKGKMKPGESIEGQPSAPQPKLP
jgi:hypothetical protein